MLRLQGCASQPLFLPQGRPNAWICMERPSSNQEAVPAAFICLSVPQTGFVVLCVCLCVNCERRAHLPACRRESNRGGGRVLEGGRVAGMPGWREVPANPHRSRSSPHPQRESTQENTEAGKQKQHRPSLCFWGSRHDEGGHDVCRGDSIYTAGVVVCPQLLALHSACVHRTPRLCFRHRRQAPAAASLFRAIPQ